MTTGAPMEAAHPIAKGTVIGTLLNFRGALVQLSGQWHEAPYKAPPLAPVLYIKPRNTWTTHGADIVVPRDVSAVETGATLGVVIGATLSRVSADRVMDGVAGYTVVNDLTVPHQIFYRPALRARCRDHFCPMGPALVAREAVTDPGALSIRVYVNGELRQQNTLRHLVRTVPELLADICEFMTLSAGDVVLVGVPEASPLATAGDRVAVEIDAVGRLENTLRVAS